MTRGLDRRQLVRRRARLDRALIAAAITAAALAVALLIVGPLQTDAVAAAAVRATLRDADLADATVVLTARVGQDRYETLDELITRAVRRATRTAPVMVVRTARSGSYTLPATAAGDGEPSAVRPAEPLAVLGFVRDADLALELASGRWPSDAGGTADAIEVAAHAGAAAALRLTPGDELTLEGRVPAQDAVTVRIVGTYDPGDRTAPLWGGDPLAAEGVDTSDEFTTYGPLLTSEGAFLERIAGAGVSADWRVVVNTDRLQPEQVAGLRRGVAALAGERDATLNEAGVRVETGLPELLRTVEDGLLSTRTGILVATAPLAALAGYALVALGGLLAERRRQELGLLIGRGAGTQAVTGLALLEGALVAAVAAPAGIAIATGAVWLIGRTGGLRGVAPRVDLVTVAAAVVAAGIGALALAVPAAVASRRARRVGRSSARGLAQRFGLDIIVAVAAALACASLLRSGVVVAGLDDELAADPLLSGAPALALLAGALLALRLVPLAARVAEPAVRRRRGVVAPLAARLLIREPGRQARVAFLVAFAAGTGVFALAYAATVAAAEHARADFAAGADLRVQPDAVVDTPPIYLATAYAAIGVQPMPAASFPARLPRSVGRTDVLALDAAAAADVVRLAGGQTALFAPLAGARTAADGIAIAGEPTSMLLELTTLLEPLRGDVSFLDPAAERRRDVTPEFAEVAVVLRDANGLLTRMPARALEPDQLRGEVVVDLVAGDLVPRWPLTLVAAEVTFAGADFHRTGAMRLHRVAVAEANEFVDLPIPGDWVGAETAIAAWESPTLAEGPGFGAVPFVVPTEQRTRVRMLAAQPTPPAPIPAIATQRFVDGSGLTVGDVVEPRTGVPVQITAVVPAFPTVDPAVLGALLVDLPSLASAGYAADGMLLEPQEWWLSAPSGVPDGLASGPLAGRVTDRAALLAEGLSDPFAAGLGGALLLTAGAVAALTASTCAASAAAAVRQRRSDVAILLAIGTRRSQIGTALAAEGLTAAGFGAATGALLGVLVTHLVLPALVAGVGGVRATVVLPAVPLAVLGAGVAGVLGLITRVQRRAAGRVVVRTALREAAS